jgi:aspartate carbamoyltransferase regulatory subunit
MKNLIFYIHCKKKKVTLPLSKHFTNYSETKKIWIILQLIYSPADVKQTSVICPLKTINMILCNHVLEHIPDDTNARIVSRLKARRDGHFTNLKSYQEL